MSSPDCSVARTFLAIPKGDMGLIPRVKEVLLEKEMATYSHYSCRKTHGKRLTGPYSPWPECKKAGYDLVTKQQRTTILICKFDTGRDKMDDHRTTHPLSGVC